MGEKLLMSASLETPVPVLGLHCLCSQCNRGGNTLRV